MSHNFLNQDLGSEEEDDDFNPAPADESDNEEADEKVGILATYYYELGLIDCADARLHYSLRSIPRMRVVNNRLIMTTRPMIARRLRMR